MKMLIFWLSCSTLFVVPIYFVWNQVYKDGIVGRGALLVISGIAATFLLQEALSENETYDMLPQTVALVAAFAVFLVWHLWRFHRRVDKRDARCPPECPQDRRTTPDRRYLPG